jgi:hypothetical protein
MRTWTAIRWLDLTASELRAAVRRAKNVSAARRILCPAMVLNGSDRKNLGPFGIIDPRCACPPSCGEPCRKGSVKIIS